MKDFIYRLRVQIEDSDFAGVAYHANYLNYFERARSEWMHQHGFDIKWQQKNNTIFAVAHVSIDYIKSAFLGDELEVLVNSLNVKNVGLVVEQYIRLRDNPEKILTKATTKLACIDHQYKLTKIPEALKKELAK